MAYGIITNLSFHNLNLGRTNIVTVLPEMIAIYYIYPHYCILNKLHFFTLVQFLLILIKNLGRSMLLVPKFMLYLIKDSRTSIKIYYFS